MHRGELDEFGDQLDRTHEHFDPGPDRWAPVTVPAGRVNDVLDGQRAARPARLRRTVQLRRVVGGPDDAAAGLVARAATLLAHARLPR